VNFDFNRGPKHRRALALCVALAGAALATAGCGTGGISSGAADRANGKELFVKNCGSCHTLADAGTQGKIGPNLDEAFGYARDDSLPGQGFSESTIRDVVRGQIAYPVREPPTGDPGMPANLVTGEDADAVAAFVAAVAGNPEAIAQAGGEDALKSATDGKSIFTAAGCGSCHTFAAAGTSGTIGPNLDEAKPSTELAIERVTNGAGVMPSFKDKLTEQQIRTVAEYVSQSS
jgi:mono/diheme cytochrome c family protein